MARSSATITPAEVQEWMKFCRDNDIVADGSEKGLANADFAHEYFTKTWGEDITAANLAAAKTLILPHLHVYTPDELEFNAVLAKLNPTEAKIFQDWKPPRGLKQTERAATAILSWLTAHKFEISPKNLDLAVGQRTIQQFLEYEYVPTHVQSEHSRTDDGTKFLGDGLRKLPDGSWGRTRADYAREARQAAEKANPQPKDLSSDELRWKALADEKRDSGNSHSQRDQLKKAYSDAVAAGLDWRRVFEAVNKLYVEFRRVAQTADRSGYYRR
jgi:hypothetical protein